MNRRTLLCQCAGAGAAATLAGCIADRPGAGSDDPDAEPEEQPVATDGGNESTDDEESDDGAESSGDDSGNESDDATDGGMSSPKLVGTDAETHGDADEARDEAEVSFGDESVTVEGTITAPTPSYEAAVKDAEYSEADDEFRATMTTRERDAGDVSIQPITGKEYTLEATFDGGTPIHVTVRHETPGDETVTVAEDSRR